MIIILCPLRVLNNQLFRLSMTAGLLVQVYSEIALENFCPGARFRGYEGIR